MRPGAGGSVPVIVLTGFLGSGKTTLLNALLRSPAIGAAAVIVNEFGAVGIDHLLVDHVEGDMLMLTTGCLCCAARGDLVEALAALFDRRKRGEIAFERVVIETTGLADPAPVVNALLPSPELGWDCRLEGVVTMIDALAGSALGEVMDEAIRQTILADVLVLSKADLIAADRRDDAIAMIEVGLRAINPMAPIVGAQDPDAILGALRSPRAPRPKPGFARSHVHLHGIEARALATGPVDPSRFESFLHRLSTRHGADLLRLKGLLAVSDDPERPVLVNAVHHRLHPARRLDGWPDEDRGTRLMVIARSGAMPAIVALWNAFFGPPSIDRADAAPHSFLAESGPGLF